MPELVIDGTSAVISAVRFTWTIRCPWCRETTRVASDDGAIRAGLTVSRTGKTCRWYQRDKPGTVPRLPGSCPHCGRDGAFTTWTLEEAEPLPDDRTALPLLDRVWVTLRASYPAEAARADDAMMARLRTAGRRA